MATISKKNQLVKTRGLRNINNSLILTHYQVLSGRAIPNHFTVEIVVQGTNGGLKSPSDQPFMVSPLDDAQAPTCGPWKNNILTLLLDDGIFHMNTSRAGSLMEHGVPERLLRALPLRKAELRGSTWSRTLVEACLAC